MNHSVPTLDPSYGGRTQTHPVVEGSLRVAPLVGMPGLLLEFGIDPAAMLQSVGLDPALLTDLENTISYDALGQLLMACAKRTGCPHFGLLVGQRAGVDCLGLIGQWSPHVADVGTSLHGLIRHLHLHDRGAASLLSVEKNVAILSYMIYGRGIKGTYHIYDAAVAIIFNIMRALCGPRWVPTEVLFAHRQPEELGPYRCFFQAPLCFDREQTALVFPSRWLQSKSADPDPLQRQRLEAQIANVEHRGPRDLVGQLRCALATLTLTQRACLEQAAELFSMHPRTLNRRLAEKGTTFHALAESVRYELACQFLDNTSMPIGQIAASLGYAETSAFTRAFRRWSGLSPLAWQGRLKPKSPQAQRSGPVGPFSAS